MEDVKKTLTAFVIKNKQLSSVGLGQAFTLIVPEGYGLSFLRRFVYSGCKPIGEREELALMLECQ
jgi:hypothetical protein